MNKFETDTKESRDTDRFKILEKRIEELERKLANKTEQFLEEDLKVRGMK